MPFVSAEGDTVGFEVVENPRTGEYAVLRRPAGDAQLVTVADLYARPGAAVAHEHVHPTVTETFTVVRGRVGFVTDGHCGEASPGTRVVVPAGTAHAWWTVGDETAWVVVEVDREMMKKTGPTGKL